MKYFVIGLLFAVGYFFILAAPVINIIKVFNSSNSTTLSLIFSVVAVILSLISAYKIFFILIDKSADAIKGSPKTDLKTPVIIFIGALLSSSLSVYLSGKSVMGYWEMLVNLIT